MAQKEKWRIPRRFCGTLATSPMWLHFVELLPSKMDATIVISQPDRTPSDCTRHPMSATDASQDRFSHLLLEAQKGDPEAIGTLLVEYRQYLVFLARAQIHHQLQAKGDPSDIAQEVCLAAAANIDQFHGACREDFAAWLRGILVRKLAMHLRHFLGTHKRDIHLECHLDQSLTQASNFLRHQLDANLTSPSQHVIRDEQYLQLAAALESLKPEYREVILLRHMDGLAFSEVATKMQRSINAVEKLWIRALAQLRSVMGAHHE